MAYKATDIQEALNKTGKYNLDVDGVIGPKTTAAIKDFQTQNKLAVDGIVGDKTWAALNKAQNTATAPTTNTSASQTETKAPSFSYEAYTPSDTVKQAEALLQQQLASKPGEYQSAWQTQLNDTLSKILNREKFSYDLNGDMLYNQYKDQYTTQGKLAMMDTMGQAAAMTGGYGNSYAQTAGQQAYQGYLQQLNDKIPELYQMALNQYNQEGDDLYNQAALMAQQEDQDYGRYRDSVSDYNAELSRLTEDARYKASDEYTKWADQTNMDYSMYRDDVSDNQWNQSFQYQQDRDAVSDAQWQKTFDEGIRQFNAQQSMAAASAAAKADKGTTYKSLDVGSDAYNLITEDIDSAKSYPELVAITKKYLGLGYDPDEIEALTAARANALKPKIAHDNTVKYQGGLSGAYAMVN